MPGAKQLKAIPPLDALLSVPVSEVIQTRPELQTFKLALERANNRVALRRNDLEPSLNASVELSRDFGQIGPGEGGAGIKAGGGCGQTWARPIEPLSYPPNPKFLLTQVARPQHLVAGPQPLRFAALGPAGAVAKRHPRAAHCERIWLRRITSPQRG